MSIKYATVCSGIEAPGVAVKPLGWEPVFFSEIEPFPKEVLRIRHPHVPDLGDFTQWHQWDEDLLAEVDVMIAGTPCQAFSIAGLGKSLEDERGILTLEFVRICNAIDNLRRNRGKKSLIILWENVPGVFSTKDNAFGCFIAGLVGSDGPIDPADGKRKWTRAGVVSGPKRTVAWRTLDAQYFGLAQRRRRVFLVGHSGDWAHPAEILFESEGVRRDFVPSRKAGEEIADPLGGSAQSGGFRTTDLDNSGAFIPEVSNPLTARMHKGINTTLDEGQTPIVCSIMPQNGGKDYASKEVEIAQPLMARGSIDWNQGGDFVVHKAVRRLTPRECERLQGFPDDYTLIPTKVKRLEPADSGPCVKQTVTATLVTPTGQYFSATNHCEQPQTACPRADMPTGVGYELCRNVCHQPAHAEVNVIRLAGKRAAGSTLYLEGHTYACEACHGAARVAGVVSIVIGPPPGNAADTPRYKALGNSMATKVIRWICTRINSALKVAA